MTRIETVALAIQAHEGYYPPSLLRPKGSVAYRNNNPGNIVFGPLAEAYRAKTYWQHPTTGHKFAIFPSYRDGFEALCKLVENAASGKSAIYNPEMTILEFFSKYSPVRDKNGKVIPNHTYAGDVAKRLNMSVSDKVKLWLEGEATLPPVPAHKWVQPIDKVHYTQLFGENPKIYAQFGLKGHNGIDYRTRFVDSPLGRRYIVAVTSGVVIEVKDEGSKGYGKFVRLQHEGNEQTVYAHLHKWYVKVGQKVKTGERIALSNNSGFSSGPHLHFGWRPNNFNVNNGFKGYENPINNF